MSRGAGNVMRRVLIVLAELGHDRRVVTSYDALATAIYGIDNPTTSQKSAVARAARRLEQRGLVEIFTWEHNQRRRFVGLSPWVPPAAMVVSRWGSETRPFVDKLAETVEVLKSLAEEDLFKVAEGNDPIDPTRRQLIVGDDATYVVTRRDPMVTPNQAHPVEQDPSSDDARRYRFLVRVADDRRTSK